MTASAEGRAPDERIKMTVSERSARELAEGLTGWLAARLGDAEQAAGGPPDAVTGLTVHSARFSGSGGLSSTSVLFEAGWVSGGAERHGRYVARLAPEASAVPVFPRYDLATQFEVISQVAARSDVPVPAVRWYEPDEQVLGSPFFLMDQVDGRVPLDNPPYVFTGWLLDATAGQLSQLQRASVQVLAALHAIAEPATAFPGLCPPGGADSLRWHAGQQREYYRWALSGDGIRVPIIERSLDWLAEHWPRDPGPDVLSWGTPGSATSSTRASSRPPCWTGRWPRSARASSTSAGSSSCTGSSRTSRRSSSSPGCPASCAAPTCSAATRS